jgi:hypothetical protein
MKRRMNKKGRRSIAVCRQPGAIAAVDQTGVLRPDWILLRVQALDLTELFHSL